MDYETEMEDALRDIGRSLRKTQNLFLHPEEYAKRLNKSFAFCKANYPNPEEYSACTDGVSTASQSILTESGTFSDLNIPHAFMKAEGRPVPLPRPPLPDITASNKSFRRIITSALRSCDKYITPYLFPLSEQVDPRGFKRGKMFYLACVTGVSQFAKELSQD